jgi:hypothetical protein
MLCISLFMLLGMVYSFEEVEIQPSIYEPGFIFLRPYYD